MTKKDSTEPDVKRRRKGARTVDSSSPNVAESLSAKTSKAMDTSQQTQMKRTQRQVSSSCTTAKNVSLSEVSAIDLETTESKSSESVEDVGCCRRTCHEIELLVAEIDHLKTSRGQYNQKAISERRIKSILLILSLKKLNRLTLIKSKTAREKTHEMKQKVDILHLELQNLLYEVAHMKREIQNCTEFTSKDEDIDLIDIQTFYEEATPEVSKPEVTRNDVHFQMLARLEWELLQRKKLATMKNQLLRDKLVMEKEILKRTEILASLQPSIDGILKATIPLQERLGLKIDERKAQYETATLLPEPLYVLYVHANAHCEGGENDLSISIDGDDQAAKAFIENDALKLGEYDDSEPEEGNDCEDKEENKRRKRSVDKERARIEEQRRTIFRKHPLNIHITVTCKGAMDLHLIFGYLTSMNIVTVSSFFGHLDDREFSFKSSSSILSPDSILENLFGEEDDGEDSPNLLNRVQLEKLGLQSFSAYINKVGRPYYWAQRISGLSYLSKSQEKNCILDEIHRSQNFACTMQTIKSRMTARLGLQKQLLELATLSVPVCKSVTLLFPPNIQTKLVDWKCITYSDFMDFYCPKDSFHCCKETDLFYTLQLCNGKEEISVAVSIGVDYPWQPPLFVVKQTQSMHLRNIGREIEGEMNVNFVELAEAGMCTMLLSNQIYKLMVCFDIFCETADLGFKQERVYIRKRRGRDRSRPCKYVQDKGLFVH